MPLTIHEPANMPTAKRMRIVTATPPSVFAICCSNACHGTR